MNSNISHVDATITAVYRNGVDIGSDRVEAMPDELTYSAEIVTNGYRGRVDRHVPIRLTRTANVLSAPVGSPCRLRVDVSTGMGELYCLAEEIVFADCGDETQPGGPVIGMETPVPPLPNVPRPIEPVPGGA